MKQRLRHSKRHPTGRTTQRAARHVSGLHFAKRFRKGPAAETTLRTQLWACLRPKEALEADRCQLSLGCSVIAQSNKFLGIELRAEERRLHRLSHSRRRHEG